MNCDEELWLSSTTKLNIHYYKKKSIVREWSYNIIYYLIYLILTSGSAIMIRYYLCWHRTVRIQTWIDDIHHHSSEWSQLYIFLASWKLLRVYWWISHKYIVNALLYIQSLLRKTKNGNDDNQSITWKWINQSTNQSKMSTNSDDVISHEYRGLKTWQPLL